MRLTIIPTNGSVGKDGKFYNDLALSSCGVPTDVHALQWEEHEPNKGHIEFKSALVQNQNITELPAWANACVAKWDEAETARLAAEEAVRLAAAEAARIAANQAQQTGQ
jgi:hypothetical protein